VNDSDYLRSEGFARSVRARTIAHASEWVYSLNESESITGGLLESAAPGYYIEFNGVSYPVGYSMERIEREVRIRGINQFAFRYGVPSRALTGQERLDTGASASSPAGGRTHSVQPPKV
jgi:hypothetical protein